MIRPFATDPQFSSQFPTADEFREILLASKSYARHAVARLWLSEGLPYAFRECPGVYEDIRGWMSEQFKVVHPKQITLIGSARTGYSFADFGKPFSEKSDLDFCVVSDELFGLFSSAFATFKDDYQARIVSPRNDRELGYWNENVRVGANNISLGFFDANKLPNRDRYEIAQRVSQAMWILQNRLKVTPCAPKVRNASVRVYRDWRSLIERLVLNLKVVVGKSR